MWAQTCEGECMEIRGQLWGTSSLLHAKPGGGTLVSWLGSKYLYPLSWAFFCSFERGLMGKPWPWVYISVNLEHKRKEISLEHRVLLCKQKGEPCPKCSWNSSVGENAVSNFNVLRQWGRGCFCARLLLWPWLDWNLFRRARWPWTSASPSAGT